MARICELCGKGVLVGRSVSHAHNRTKKRFLPNLRKVRLVLDGKARRLKVCGDCLKQTALPDGR